MWKIPLFDITFDRGEIEAVQQVLRSGWLTMGEQTELFELNFAKLVGSTHAIAVSSGTAALHLAHLAVGIKAGDEVICPSFTFVAGANVVANIGVTPVFADIVNHNILNISPQDIERKITSRTKAIQIVHYAGYPCDMESISSIAQKYHLYIIEDCAHAIISRYHGKYCGVLGDIGCFSFFSNKNMTTAEGGMVTTNDDELAQKMKWLRSHGMTSQTLDRHKGHAFSYDVIELGYNYRIDELRSALGIAQLKKLPDNIRKRELLTLRYKRNLTSIRGLTIPFHQFTGTPAYHIFPIILHDPIQRQPFMEYLKQKGIQTSIHYPPTHLFTFYRNIYGDSKISLPITEHIAQREVTLPLYPSLDNASVDYICECIASFFTEKTGEKQ